ncbi:MAG: hypothetical protein ABI824_08485 [Acidobacteriota bacterium]
MAVVSSLAWVEFGLWIFLQINLFEEYPAIFWVTVGVTCLSIATWAVRNKWFHGSRKAAFKARQVCNDAQLIRTINFLDEAWRELTDPDGRPRNVQRLVRYQTSPADGCISLISTNSAEHKLIREIAANDPFRAGTKVQFWACLPSQEEKVYFLVQTEMDGTINPENTWLECVPGKESLKPVRAEDTNYEYRIHIEGKPATFKFVNYCLDLAWEINRIEPLAAPGWSFSQILAIQVRYTGQLGISGFTSYR